ncbi:MAG TPA: AraC family transcriptional regulator [Caulobacteraceae bacterium]|jgi:AraC-like DNA-binding protein|nr:AraC family transcriptional regulator [Caulobacteraceae bacterium]
MQDFAAANPFRTDGFRPTALRSNRAFQSRDVEFTRDRISQILQPHQLTPVAHGQGGDFYTDHIAVGDLGIGAIHFGAMNVEVTEFADYHLVLACLAGNARIVTDVWERDIGANRAAIVAPGSYMRAEFSSDCEQLFVRIPTRAIRSHSPYRQLEFLNEVDLTAPSIAPFITQVAQICSLEATASLLHKNAVVRREFERLLVCLLLAGQAHRDEANRSGTQIAPKAVRRAETFIRSNSSLPISLSEIARAAQVPTRTLLDSFKRFRGTSPMQYLRNVRLESARLLLQSGRALQISDVAFDAGFTHLGRFASAYAERFGELPSETLRRR